MRNVIWALVFLLVLAALLLLGYEFVPNVRAGGAFSNDFVFNVYIALLEFIATAVVIAQLTAYFVNRKLNREWLSARSNARDRLNASVKNLFSNYCAFLRSTAAGDSDTLSDIMFQLTIKRIREFLATYEHEHPAFNANMHSAASNVRREMGELLRSLETTEIYAFGRAPFRLVIARYELDKLRALFDKPRLASAEAPWPVERDPYFNPAEPIVIEKDPYFQEKNRLFFDGSLDVGIGGGPHTIHPFKGSDIPYLRSQWTEFLKACPDGDNVENGVPIAKDLSLAVQITAHSSFLKRKIGDAHILAALLGE
jgi:hypothetical protein